MSVIEVWACLLLLAGLVTLITGEMIIVFSVVLGTTSLAAFFLALGLATGIVTAEQGDVFGRDIVRGMLAEPLFGESPEDRSEAPGEAGPPRLPPMR